MSESDAQILSIGTIVHSRYQITAIVGRGGLGTVYQVVDVLFSKHNIFALKELIDQSSGARKQFELESQWLQSLDHDNIPKVREHFEWQQRLYLVMDFVEGENLEQILARLGGRPLPERQVIQWILPICDALYYLHSRMPPILHRDVKPANIIVTPAGHPVLVDLGIAKEHLPGASMTATFVRKAGTEGYAPPEQYSTAGQTGPWSDVYGLGATLYHLLTGHIPPTAIERVALESALVSPHIINPTVSSRTDTAICRALTLRPSDRFQSVLDFKHALVKTSEASVPMPRPVTRQPALVAMPVPHQQPLGPQPIRPVNQPPDLSVAMHKVPATSAPPPYNMPQFDQSKPSGTSETSQHTGNLGSSQFRASTARLPAVTLGSIDSIGKIEPNNARNRVSAPPKLLRAPLLAIIALSLVMIGAIAGYAVLRAYAPPDRSSATATVEGYFAALHNRDYSRAWHFVSASRNDVSTQGDLTTEWRADDVRFGPVLNMSIANTETDGNGKVTLQVHVVRAHAPSTAMNYILIVTQYDGSTWLIDSISVA